MLNPSTISQTMPRTGIRRAYPLEVRQRAVALHKEGLGYKRIGKALGIERSIIREWLQRYKTYGEESLQPWWRKDARPKPPKEKREKGAGLHERYREAMQLYTGGDLTRKEVCRRCGLDYNLFNYYLYTYHPQYTRSARNAKPADGTDAPPKRKGRTNGPHAATVERYREAVELYRTTALTVDQIAAQANVDAGSLRYYIGRWHRPLMLERRGGKVEQPDGHIDLSQSKRYLKSTARKYATAIECLRRDGESTAAVAARFGLNADNLRRYLHEHEPELARSLGREKQEDGRRMSVRSREKYAEAVRLYGTTPEPLKSIARRLGLTYISLSGFVHRNYPELIEKHKEMRRAP